MEKLELYDKSKIYVTNDGVIIDYKEFCKRYPACKTSQMAVLYSASVDSGIKIFVGAYLYEYLLSKYISSGSDEERLEQILGQLELEKTESTPIERIASALEYLCVILTEN